MQRLLVTLVVAISLAVVAPAVADEVGLGGAWVDGHSYSGKYGVNNGGDQSWGMALHFDKDKGWFKQINGNSKIGIDPGMAYMYFRWTRNDNREREKCKSYECEDVERYIPEYQYEQPYQSCTTEEYSTNEHVNSHILGFYMKPYYELFGKVRLFGIGGFGMEFADSGGNHPLVMVGGGLQYRFTKNFAISGTQYEIFTTERRFDASVVSLDYYW